jgi:hypothetical protein
VGTFAVRDCGQGSSSQFLHLLLDSAVLPMESSNSAETDAQALTSLQEQKEGNGRTGVA